MFKIDTLTTQNASSMSDFTVIGQRFARKFNQFFFKLRHEKTGHELEKSAEEISMDRTLLRALSPEDAYLIGYVAAGDILKKEKQSLRMHHL